MRDRENPEQQGGGEELEAAKGVVVSRPRERRGKVGGNGTGG